MWLLDYVNKEKESKIQSGQYMASDPCSFLIRLCFSFSRSTVLAHPAEYLTQTQIFLVIALTALHNFVC